MDDFLMELEDEQAPATETAADAQLAADMATNAASGNTTGGVRNPFDFNNLGNVIQGAGTGLGNFFGAFTGNQKPAPNVTYNAPSTGGAKDNDKDNSNMNWTVIGLGGLGLAIVIGLFIWASNKGKS